MNFRKKIFAPLFLGMALINNAQASNFVLTVDNGGFDSHGGPEANIRLTIGDFQIGNLKTPHFPQKISGNIKDLARSLNLSGVSLTLLEYTGSFNTGKIQVTIETQNSNNWANCQNTVPTNAPMNSLTIKIDPMACTITTG